MGATVLGAALEGVLRRVVERVNTGHYPARGTRTNRGKLVVTHKPHSHLACSMVVSIIGQVIGDGVRERQEIAAPLRQGQVDPVPVSGGHEAAVVEGGR